MTGYDILSLKESEKWHDYLSRLPNDQQDIYFTPEYYDLYENLGDGKALCFVYYENKDTLLYPFLMDSVNKLGYKLDKQYFDIQGAYGYNGVASSSYSESFKKSFLSVFKKFIEEHAIIAEFTRFNPILKNNRFSNYLNPQYNQDNIIIDLKRRDIERNCYEYSTRKNIKKALKNNLSCSKYISAEIKQSYIKEFLHIYYATMQRNNAEKKFFFPYSFFENISKNLSNNSIFYFVQYNETFISTELIILGNSNAYSFLGGTIAKYFEFRPNDLLKDYIIKDLKKKKLKYYCLGGGTEGIIRFKKSFCKNGDVAFYIGKKVHNKKIYNEIIRQWEQKYPEKSQKYKNFFLKYRY